MTVGEFTSCVKQREENREGDFQVLVLGFHMFL